MEWRDENPIAAVVETSGVWQVSIDNNGRSIQIIAYSPSIEREVNMEFGAASNDIPMGLTVAGARRIVQEILDSIAQSR